MPDHELPLRHSPEAESLLIKNPGFKRQKQARHKPFGSHNPACHQGFPLRTLQRGHIHLHRHLQSQIPRRPDGENPSGHLNSVPDVPVKVRAHHPSARHGQGR